MDLPSHKDAIYVAVISQVEDVFVLHEVYQKQPKQLNSTFDIVLPQRYSYLNVCPITCSDINLSENMTSELVTVVLSQ